MTNEAVYGIDFARPNGEYDWLSEFREYMQDCVMAGLTSDQIVAILNLTLAVSKYHIMNMWEIVRSCEDDSGRDENDLHVLGRS